MRLPHCLPRWGAAALLVFFSPALQACPPALQSQEESSPENAGLLHATPLGTEFSQKDLEDLGEEVQVALQNLLGREIRPIPFRLASSEEIAKALLSENIKAFKIQLPEETSPEEIEAAAEAFCQAAGELLLAKFALETGEVLVNLDNFFSFEELLEIDGIATRQTLTVVMVHEAFHALCDREYNLSSLSDKCENADEFNAANALIEGYAQFYARQACQSMGLEDAFQLFTGIIDFVPPQEDPVQELILNTVVAQFSFWYGEGEEFITAVHEARGDEGVSEALLSPPLDSALISRPEWYLKPETRQSLDSNLEERFAQTVDWLKEKGTEMQTLKLLDAQLRAIFADLPEEETAPVIKELQGNRMAIYNTGKSLLTLGVFSLRSSLSAQAFFSLEESLLRARDKIHREGNIKIVESIYKPFKEGDLFGETSVGDYEGILVWKKVQEGSREMEMEVLIGVREQAVLEITGMKRFKALPQEKLINLANMILDPSAEIPPSESEEPASD